jgi:hypothetical protein
MPNKRFLQAAERWKNPSLPDEKPRTKQSTSQPIATQTVFPNLPSESFIFSYDGPHKDFFQELIAKSNERFKGTKAEIKVGTTGEVSNAYLAKRMALISTIAGDSNLRKYGLLPITPMQSEFLLQAGKLPKPDKYWEDLALLLYDINGSNQKEAITLKEDIARHRVELGLSQSDLEKRLVIANPGAEPDKNMNYGIKPIIIPGITLVYTQEIMNMTGKDHKFEYGLDGGLPSASQIGQGNRTLYMPSSNDNIGLRVLYRDGYLDLGAGDGNLADSNEDGRVNFAPQGQTP